MNYMFNVLMGVLIAANGAVAQVFNHNDNGMGYLVSMIVLIFLILINAEVK